MSTKVFNTRLQLKYDSWKNWYDNNPTLFAGEIAIVNVPAQTNESTGEVTQKPAILFKVGDGTTDFRTLDWASGLAADVYGWAKREKGLATEIFTTDDVSVEDVLSALKETLDNLEASEVAYTKKAKNEAGETIPGEEINVEVALDSLYEAISTLSGDSSESIADLITKVNKNSENIVKAQADATQALADAAAANENANSRVSTSDFEAFKSTNSQAIADAAQAAADANANAETRVKTADFETFKTANTQAIEAAAAGVQGNLDAYEEANDAALAGVKATAEAAAVKADVDAAFEGVNATIETLATKADVAASFETVNGEIADINEAIAGINEAAATHATKEELATAKEEASAAAAKALEDAQAYADEIKSDLLGESETLEGTYDTLKEIAGWIATHEGETVVELTTAISDEEAARKAADEDFETRVSALEGKVDVEKVSDAIDAGVAGEATLREAADTALSNRIKDLEDNKAGYATTTQVATAKQEAIDAAAADATSKADAAEADANAYTDEKIGDLHTVASTGKLGDLENEGRATTADADYVIFYCGTASILTNPEVTE